MRHRALDHVFRHTAHSHTSALVRGGLYLAAHTPDGGRLSRPCRTKSPESCRTHTTRPAGAQAGVNARICMYRCGTHPRPDQNGRSRGSAAGSMVHPESAQSNDADPRRRARLGARGGAHAPPCPARAQQLGMGRSESIWRARRHRHCRPSACSAAEPSTDPWRALAIRLTGRAPLNRSQHLDSEISATATPLFAAIYLRRCARTCIATVHTGKKASGAWCYAAQDVSRPLLDIITEKPRFCAS